MKVIILGNWSNCSGTDYCAALGNFDSLKAAEQAAMDYAWSTFENGEEDEDSLFEYDGPDYYIEEYNPEKHDMLKAGGGSHEDDFVKWHDAS